MSKKRKETYRRTQRSRDAPERRSGAGLVDAGNVWEILCADGYKPLTACPEVQMCAAVYADLIGAMVGGVTSGGAAGGADTIGLEEAIHTIDAIVEALDRAGHRVPVLAHGGPLNDTGPVQTVLNRTRAMGYITGSTGERLPTQQAVKEKISAFKAIRRGGRP